MAVFMLDTDSVSAGKSNIDSLASQVDTLSSTVNGYDTTCEDFDFSSAKSVIAGNLDALSIKIKNTSSMIDSVVSSHTTLQNGLKFNSTSGGDSDGKKADGKGDKKPADSSGDNSNNGGSNSGSRVRSPGGSTGGGYNVTPVAVTPVTTTPATTAPEQTVVEVTEKIEKIDHIKLDTNSLTDEAKKLLENVKYSDLGYAMLGEMMVIACSSAVGKVGEVIEITLKDGSKVNCIIGKNLEGTGEIQFFVNDSWKEDNEKNPTASLTDKIDKIHNLGTKDLGTGAVSLAGLPAIGEHTSKWSKLNDDWTVATTKISIADYEKVVSSKKISQNSDTSKYSDYCLAFSYVHAYDLYNGVTSDTAADAGNYRHAGAFTSFYSDSKADTLQKIYSEIVQGRPVVMQVNGNKAGTSRHFVTVVGFRNSITDPTNLTEKDLLIMDSWDGKVERMDQDTSRFMTTGKQTGKDYTGYYLRLLKA